MIDLHRYLHRNAGSLVKQALPSAPVNPETKNMHTSGRQTTQPTNSVLMSHALSLLMPFEPLKKRNRRRTKAL